MGKPTCQWVSAPSLCYRQISIDCCRYLLFSTKSDPGCQATTAVLFTCVRYELLLLFFLALKLIVRKFIILNLVVLYYDSPQQHRLSVLKKLCELLPKYSRGNLCQKEVLRAAEDINDNRLVWQSLILLKYYIYEILKTPSFCQELSNRWG